MRIAILGAAGKVGGLTVTAAVTAGYDTIAFARDPKRIPTCNNSPLLSKVAGDIRDRVAVERAILPADVVICTFGAPLNMATITGVPDVCTRGMQQVVDVMRGSTSRRVVCMTAIGVGDSRRRGRWAFRNIIRPLLLGRIMRDRESQEAVLRSSGLSWSILRPAELTDGPAAPWRLVEAGDMTPPEPARVSRATVAQCLVHEAVHGALTHRTLLVCNNT